MRRARANALALLLRRGLWLALAAASLALFAPQGAQAQVLRNFTQRNPTTNARGNIALIGNVLISCRAQGSQSATCAAARAGNNGNNSDFTTAFVDADSDNTTTNSSSATLTLPSGSTVLWAGLYWGARSTGATRNQIRFRAAGSGTYTTLTATQLDSTVAASNAYQGFVDVTTRVQTGGNGTYWAAGITADNGQDGTGFYAGWSLIVVYQDNNQPLRNLTVFDGFASVSSGNNVTTTVNGLLTPVSGTFTAFAGMVAYEGDRGISGDSFQITNASNVTTTIGDALNPTTNFFNSSITTAGTRFSAKNPDYVNQLGFDVDTVSVANANTVLGNGATSTRLTFTSSQDLYYPGVLTFAVEVYLPQIEGNITKSVTDLNGGVVGPGDQLEYTITMVNTGNDNAANIVLRDPIPADTTFVAGSLQVTAGANAGVKSDGAGDDQAEYDAGLNRVVFRLGTGATAVAGGTLAPTASTTIRFRVSINPGTLDSAVISNQATTGYNAATLGTAYTTLSDGDPVTPGTQATNISVVSPPAIELVKDSPQKNTTLLPGSEITYVITFRNTGGRAASSFTVADKLPAETEFKVGSILYAPGTPGPAAPTVSYTNAARNPANEYPPNPFLPLYTPTGTYDGAVTYISFAFGNLSPNASGTITFVVRIK